MKTKLSLIILFLSLFISTTYAKIQPVVQQGHSDFVTSVAFSPDGKYIASGSYDRTVKLWDVNAGKLVNTFEGHSNWVTSVTFSPDGKFIVSGSDDGTIKLWDVNRKKLVATMIALPDASIVITPEGYFSGTGNYQDYVHFIDTETLKVYTLDQYYETFYRPDLVKLTLKGFDISNIAKNNINNVKPEPEVVIIQAPEKTNNSTATIKTKIIDQSGGIGDTVIFLNGTAVKTDNTRAIRRTDTKKVGYQTYTIPLINRKNVIEVKAYNSEKTQISKPARHIVYANVRNIQKPNLYAVIVGINEYRNPKLKLRYAVSDAVALSRIIKQLAQNSGLYETVDVLTLSKKEETDKKTILNKLREVLKKVKPNDLFIFAVSSHGIAIDGKYYWITSNVGSVSPYRLKKDALTQDEIKDILSNISATKKIVIFDTCNSGKFADELQYALATRGLDEETALNILSKSTDVVVLAASSEVQYAFEGCKEHGVFSYALIEGLNGEADLNRDGYRKTLELSTYIDNKVPELTKNVFKKEQFPYSVFNGNSFPIVKINN